MRQADMLRALLDLLFPPRCAACRVLVSGSGPFCRPCSETLTELPAHHCPVCGEPEMTSLCERCREEPPAFERVIAPYLHGGALADAIHRLKYEDRPQLARPLCSLLEPAIQPDLAWCDLIAPVSLHERRLRSRGYDQALLLARELARRTGRQVVPRAVRRVRETSPQVGKSRLQREVNVAGAFVATPSVSGRKVLLVDDVLTTGATAQAAARACLDAGALAVRVAALARAG